MNCADKDWLYNEYIILEKSISRIAKVCEKSISTIWKLLGEYGIPIRTPIEGTHLLWKNKKYRDRDWLYEQYVTLRKSSHQIANENDFNKSAVLKWLEKFGIERRTKSEALIGKKLSPEHRLKAIASAKFFPSGSAHPNWIGGFEIEQVCEVCGTSFTTRKDAVAKGQGRFCSRECRYEGLSGENSSTWKGGASFEPYGLDFNNRLREQIRGRDNYICQECGITQEKLGRRLDVHHIDYDKTNNKPENLISLCPVCHGKTNCNRECWTEHFRKIIEMHKRKEVEISKEEVKGCIEKEKEK